MDAEQQDEERRHQCAAADAREADQHADREARGRVKRIDQMEKTQRQALPWVTTDIDSNSGSWFPWVGRAPPAIVGSPPVFRIPDVEDHIV